MSKSKLAAAPGSAFVVHRDTTAADCEAIAKSVTELAATVRQGDLKAFERFWIEGGTEEGDAKICSLRETIVLRYLCREEELNVPNSKAGDA